MSGDVNMDSKKQLTPFEEKFLEHVSVISDHFKNDSMNEWTYSTMDRSRIDNLIRSRLYYDRQLMSENWTFTDEEYRYINLLIEIIIQKYNGLNRNINRARIYIGVLSIYGFQDLSGKHKFFKIPVVKIIRSDYGDGHYILLNGTVFGDLDVMFQFIENMPSATLCVPSQYQCYIENILSSKNGINLFKTLDICENCFNECAIEIDFVKLTEKLCHNANMEMDITEEITDPMHEKIQQLTDMLASTIETASSETMLDIEDFMKIETFVHSAILWGIIKKLELSWQRPLAGWRSIKTETVEKEKDAVVEELLKTINQGRIYERFKKYYISNKKLLFVDNNERETVCALRLNGTEDCDLDSFIKEICNGCYKIVDFVTSNFIYKTISFNDGKSFQIVFNEVIPGHILGCAILRNSDAFFNTEEILPFTIASNNDDISSTEELEVDVNENLEGFSDDNKTVLKEFMERTTGEQIFIAKAQGHFNPRILLKPDESTIELFVKLTVFGLDDSCDYEGLSEKKRETMIRKIKVKLMKVAKDFGKTRGLNQNVMYYDAIRLFGYRFPEKFSLKKKKGNSLYALPLFKVYRDVNDENPIFIDVDCNEYKDWNFFLERNLLNKGDFLCVPKRGCYINKKARKIEIEFFKNQPKFWTPARATLVSVNAAILIGSTALALYTGPIGWGVRALTLTTPVRLGIAGVGVGSSSIGLGIALSKKGLFMSEKFQSYAPSITFILNVTSDILMVYGEASVFAQIAAGALIPVAGIFSTYVLCNVLIKAVRKYRETGAIDSEDIWEIINASLLFGNSILKFDFVVNLIKSNGWMNKLPKFFKELPKPNVNITSDITSPSQLARFIIDVTKGQAFRMATNLLNNIIDYFKNNKSLGDFKNDLKNLSEDFIDEMAIVVEPQIRGFLKRKFGIDLRTLTGSNKPISKCLKEYVPQIFIFTLERIDEGRRLVKKLLNRLGLNDSIELPIEQVAQKLGEPLAMEGPLDPTTNIDKIMKAEEFIRSVAYKKEILKLKSCLNNDVEVTPDVMNSIVKETVEEICQDATHADFRTKFREYCSGYENLILLEEDETGKFHVFQWETEEDLKVVIREENLNIEMLGKIAENIFAYTDEDKSILIFSDNENTDNRLGFMVVLYNEMRNL